MEIISLTSLLFIEIKGMLRNLWLFKKIKQTAFNTILCRLAGHDPLARRARSLRAIEDGEAAAAPSLPTATGPGMDRLG